MCFDGLQGWPPPIPALPECTLLLAIGIGIDVLSSVPDETAVMLGTFQVRPARLWAVSAFALGSHCHAVRMPEWATE